MAKSFKLWVLLGLILSLSTPAFASDLPKLAVVGTVTLAAADAVFDGLTYWQSQKAGKDLDKRPDFTSKTDAKNNLEIASLLSICSMAGPVSGITMLMSGALRETDWCIRLIPAAGPSLGWLLGLGALVSNAIAFGEVRAHDQLEHHLNVSFGMTVAGVVLNTAVLGAFIALGKMKNTVPANDPS